MKSCVTISLVKEAEGGPFVFWHDLADGCHQAAELGYDAVEVFAPSPDAVDRDELRGLLDQYSLELAAVGTGAGWVVQKLCLTSPDAENRAKAKDFVRGIIDFGGPFGASAIIGSMQGRWDKHGVDKETAFAYLSEALNELGEYSAQYNIPLIYEPLNRYETNMITRIEDGVTFMKSLSTDNVVLLADLFHMNIEEVNVADAIRSGAGHIGHVHFVDSNRRPASCGHTDFAPIFAALKEIGYDKFLSAEAFAYPDSSEAARLTIESYKSLMQ
jgi:sugar phosphate isomerase/epimerase